MQETAVTETTQSEETASKQYTEFFNLVKEKSIYLEECIKSLFGQTVKSEIFISNPIDFKFENSDFRILRIDVRMSEYLRKLMHNVR